MTSDLITNWLARSLRFLCTGCGEPIYAWQPAIVVSYGTEHVGTFHEKCTR